MLSIDFKALPKSKILVWGLIALFVVAAGVTGIVYKDNLTRMFTKKNGAKLKYVAYKKDDDDRWGIVDVENGKVIIDGEWQNMPVMTCNDIVKVANKDGKFELFKISEKPTRIGDEYKYVGSYSDGLIPVAKENQYITFLDKEGKEVMKVKELDGKLVESVGNFSEGLALFKNEDGKWGYFDKSGKVVIKARYDVASDFSEGMARVSEETIADQPGNKLKTGFIDRSGKEIIKMSASINYKNMSEGMICFTDDDGKTYGFVNAKGEKVIKPCKDFKEVTNFNDGMAGFFDGDKWGIINNKGETVVRAKYDVAFPSSGLIFVNDNKKIGFLDYQGKEIIKPQYEEGIPFVDNRTLVKDGSKFILIDKKGNQVGKIDFRHTNETQIVNRFILRENEIIESDFFDVNAVADMIIRKVSKKEINDISNVTTLDTIMKNYGIEESDLSPYGDNVTGKLIQRLSKYAIVIPEFRFEGNVKEPIKKQQSYGSYTFENIVGYRPNSQTKVRVVGYQITFVKDKAQSKDAEILKALNAKFAKAGFKPDPNNYEPNTNKYVGDNGEVIAAIGKSSDNSFFVVVRLN